MVTLANQFDANGNRTQLASTIDSTADFVNDYQFDNLGRMKQVVQGANGGNAVARKRVDFTYTATSQFDTITRYAHNGTAYEQVASSQYGYDNTGRLTGLTYAFPAGSDVAPAYKEENGTGPILARRVIGADYDTAGRQPADQRRLGVVDQHGMSLP